MINHTTRPLLSHTPNPNSLQRFVSRLLRPAPVDRPCPTTAPFRTTPPYDSEPTPARSLNRHHADSRSFPFLRVIEHRANPSLPHCDHQPRPTESKQRLMPTAHPHQASVHGADRGPYLGGPRSTIGFTCGTPAATFSVCPRCRRSCLRTPTD